jgi:chaperonin GroEL
VGKSTTTIVTNKRSQSDIALRIAQIQREIMTSDSTYDQEKGRERVAALGGGIARIKVGAATETELKDKKLKYEDAINSVKSALEMGVVPGGGSCMVYLQLACAPQCFANAASDDERAGVDIMIKSLGAPLAQIARNAGIEGAVVLA